MTELIKPFELIIPEQLLVDLRQRLAMTRWPEAQTCGNNDWSQGVPLARAKEVIDYWQNEYDWRRCEIMLNGLGQYTTNIDNMDIHFIHARSKHSDALPLLITHGWPGSVIEFHKVIQPLIDPEAFGGKAEDAFHVIAPSLPGYGFSGKPEQRGWNVPRIASTWAQLMNRLGYEHYVAQGGDWGSAVTVALGNLAPTELAAIHLNMIVALPEGDDELSDDEQAMLGEFARFQKEETGYSLMHTTRPQTLGYSLADSPVGQAMWVYEKFQRWTDSEGDPENILSRDELLDNIMFYWLSNSGASSARLYLESLETGFSTEITEVPVACSIFPKEICRPSRHWVERKYHNIVYWNEPAKGGHFAALEQPVIFVEELRNSFRMFRKG